VLHLLIFSEEIEGKSLEAKEASCWLCKIAVGISIFRVKKRFFLFARIRTKYSKGKGKTRREFEGGKQSVRLVPNQRLDGMGWSSFCMRLVLN
jgi:hypothetical protein